MLFVLLVQIAKSTATTLGNGAAHIILRITFGSIPNDLAFLTADEGKHTCRGFAKCRVAKFLVDMRSGARATAIVEET